MDHKAEQALRDKLSNFEATVPESLWGGIADAIDTSPVQPPVMRSLRGYTFTTILLLLFGVGSYTVTTLSEPTLLAGLAEGAPVQSMAVVASQEVGEQDVAWSQTLPPLVIELDEVVIRARKYKAPVAATEGPGTNAINNEVVMVLATEESEKPDLVEALGLQAYPFSEWSVEQVEGLTIDFDSSYYEPAKPWRLRLKGGLTLNYLNITPNPGDDFYFDDIASDFDLSSGRLGLSVGVDVLRPLNNRWTAKGSLSLGYRQFTVAGRYIEDASSRDNQNFQSFDSQYHQLMSSVTLGLDYKAGSWLGRAIHVDAGIMMDQYLVNDLAKDDLLGAANANLYLNLGATVRPGIDSKFKWSFRPYVFLSLDNRIGNAPLQVSPFGFGIELFK